MRYLFMVIAVCLPTWGTAGSLNADTRYLCEAETTFGWREESEFTKPEVWVSRTKYVIQPVPQQMKKRFSGGVEDVELTHIVKEWGGGKKPTHFCISHNDVAFCHQLSLDNELVPVPSFVFKQDFKTGAFSFF